MPSTTASIIARALCDIGMFRKPFRGFKKQRGSRCNARDFLVALNPIDEHRLMLSVCWPINSDNIKKVLSAYVKNAPEFGDPSFYRYCEGSVGLLSWERGIWEDAVMSDPVAPVSLVEQFPRHVLSGEGRALQ